MKRILFIIMVLLAGLMAGGTFVEKIHGPACAADRIYHAPLFIALWMAALLADLCLFVRGRLWRRLPLLLLHASFLLMTAGALLGVFTGQHGQLTLQPEKPRSSFVTEQGEPHRMPFCLRLERFEVQYAAGTRTPTDFVSHVEVADLEGRSLKKADISMNHILRYRHYRFYQNDYDAEGNSVLEVAYDPWGIALAYSGFLLLLLGLLSMFFERQGAFRQLLGHPLLNRAGVIMLLMLSALSMQAANPRVLPKGTASKMGELYVLYNGRICPLQTLAKDFTVKLYGKARYQGCTPEQVLGGWLFYYEDWQALPLREGRHREEQQQLIRRLCEGGLLKMYPHTDSSGTLHWYARRDPLPLSFPDDEYLFVRKQLSYCQELVFKNDFRQLEEVFEKTKAYQRQQAGSALPGEASFRAERLYNRLCAGRWLAMLCVTLGLLCFAVYVGGQWKGRGMPAAIRKAATLWMALLSLYLGLLFLLRWMAGGHVPMAGSHDTLLLLALCVSVFSLLFARRFQFVLPAGMLVVGFVRLVAMMVDANPPITPLMPVLSSPLLSLHVTVIMIAYALLLFVMLNGIAALLPVSSGSGRVAARERARVISLLLLYPAVSLLVVGILIGAVWANISWGRYWSWDPKEVWAMLTALAYALPLHWKSFPLFRKPRFFHAYCVLAFLCVLVTYFGVNLILGGMHAYN